MPNPIKLYSLSTCIHCHNASELLTEHAGEDGFEHIFVDRLYGEKRNDVMRELRRMNPNMSFPTMVIGDEVVLGFKEEKIRELLAG